VALGSREQGGESASLAQDLLADTELQLRSRWTYLGEILAARDSTLLRWPDRSSQPIRVWVDEAAGLEGFDPEQAAQVREAFGEWEEALLSLAFTFVSDAAAAEIRVSWVNSFADPVSGRTFWTRDQSGWIQSADIFLARRHVSGRAIRGTALRAIALHEIGHSLGLDHTADTTSVMAARVRVSHLSEIDRSTVALLYQLTPGKRSLPSAVAR
jgi:predicted Zn-dependent protease